LNQETYKVVIVGGGFAGAALARKLAKNTMFMVTVVDKNNYHFFPPLIYQVATSFIEPSNISYPFRQMFRGKRNVRFHMGILQEVDPKVKIVRTTEGCLEYDFLVLALGTEPNYFGMENIRRYALPVKTIDDSLQLRNSLLLNMERAVKAPSDEQMQQCLNIVIAGGGPTGVEIAGMMAQMGKRIKEKEYPEIQHINANIFLVDAGKAPLAAMSVKSQEEAARVLKKLGVRLLFNRSVKDFVDNKVFLSDGTIIPCNVLIWASGVQAKKIDGLPQQAIGRARRIIVDDCNRVAECQDIFAIGDICLNLTDPKYSNGHPQLAQVAIQQGRLLANNLERLVQKQNLQSFRYKDKGGMAMISKHHAVVEVKGLFFKGYFAWALWLFVHLFPLAGFRNRLRLAANWCWSFLTNNPTLRLIFRPGRIDIGQNI